MITKYKYQKERILLGISSLKEYSLRKYDLINNKRDELSNNKELLRILDNAQNKLNYLTEEQNLTMSMIEMENEQFKSNKD